MRPTVFHSFALNGNYVILVADLEHIKRIKFHCIASYFVLVLWHGVHCAVNHFPWTLLAEWKILAILRLYVKITTATTPTPHARWKQAINDYISFSSFPLNAHTCLLNICMRRKHRDSSSGFCHTFSFQIFSRNVILNWNMWNVHILDTPVWLVWKYCLGKTWPIWLSTYYKNWLLTNDILHCFAGKGGEFLSLISSEIIP